MEKVKFEIELTFPKKYEENLKNACKMIDAAYSDTVGYNDGDTFVHDGGVVVDLTDFDNSDMIKDETDRLFGIITSNLTNEAEEDSDTETTTDTCDDNEEAPESKSSADNKIYSIEFIKNEDGDLDVGNMTRINDADNLNKIEHIKGSDKYSVIVEAKDFLSAVELAKERICEWEILVNKGTELKSKSLICVMVDDEMTTELIDALHGDDISYFENIKECVKNVGLTPKAVFSTHNFGSSCSVVYRPEDCSKEEIYDAIKNSYEVAGYMFEYSDTFDVLCDDLRLNPSTLPISSNVSLYKSKSKKKSLRYKIGKAINSVKNKESECKDENPPKKFRLISVLGRDAIFDTHKFTHREMLKIIREYEGRVYAVIHSEEDQSVWVKLDSNSKAIIGDAENCIGYIAIKPDSFDKCTVPIEITDTSSYCADTRAYITIDEFFKNQMGGN